LTIDSKAYLEKLMNLTSWVQLIIDVITEEIAQSIEIENEFQRPNSRNAEIAEW
jgi:hypothetical protein